MQQPSQITEQADQLRASSKKKFALGKERLRASDDTLALLSIHGALEDGLRAYLARQGIETGAWPELIESLRADSEHPLSNEDADLLRRTNRLRNSVAHGDVMQLDHARIVDYTQFATKLLRTYGIVVNQQRASRRVHAEPKAAPATRRAAILALLSHYSNVLVPGVVALLVFIVGLWALNGWFGHTSSPTRSAQPILAETASLPSGSATDTTGNESLSNQPATIITPAPTAEPQTVPGAIAVGGRAVVSTAGDPLNLRSLPGQGADSIVLSALATGTSIEVIEGPTEADGHTWWRVRAGDQEGWCAGEFLAVQAGP